MPQASKPTTVADALNLACRYWDVNDGRGRGSRGPNMMPIRATRAAGILGLSRKLRSLRADDGARLLSGLRMGGLSRSSVASYYAAARRMLALSGYSCVDWPKAPTPPRKQRQPVTSEEVARCIDALRDHGWDDTAELVELMRDTGLRVEVEALRGDWQARGGRLEVEAGKGGHARTIPYRGPHAGPLEGLTYEGHLRRIKIAAAEAGVPDLRPHDLRRHFVKRVYDRSGKDLRVAQVLAGHADPSTTASYVGVSFEELEHAVG